MAALISELKRKHGQANRVPSFPRPNLGTKQPCRLDMLNTPTKIGTPLLYFHNGGDLQMLKLEMSSKNPDLCQNSSRSMQEYPLPGPTESRPVACPSRSWPVHRPLCCGLPVYKPHHSSLYQQHYTQQKILFSHISLCCFLSSLSFF